MFERIGLLGRSLSENNAVFQKVGNVLSQFRLLPASSEYPNNVNPDKAVSKDQSHLLTGGGIGSTSNDWLSPRVQMSSNRAKRYHDYRSMLHHGLIKAAMNMISADATTKDNINKQKFHINCESKQIKAELNHLFNNVLGLNTRLRGIIKSFISYGNHPCEIILNENKNGIAGLRALPINKFFRIENRAGKLIRFEEASSQCGYGNAITVYAPAQIVDWELRDDSSDYLPYGEPLIEGSRKAWKQLSLMESALLIYRIERAPERRVFYIDVGNVTQIEAEVIADMAKSKFKKKKYYNADTGEVDEKYSPLETSEDFFLPLSASAPNSRIDTIQGGQNVGEIDDLQLFKQNMLAPLMIPMSYMSDTFQPGVAKASLAQEDINYSRIVETTQDSAVQGLHKIAYVHLMLKGYKLLDMVKFDISLTPPSDIAELVKLDSENKRIEVAGNAINIGFSKNYAYKRYFNMSDDDIEKEIKLNITDQVTQTKIQNGLDPLSGKNIIPDEQNEDLIYEPTKVKKEEDNNMSHLENLMSSNQLAGFNEFFNTKDNVKNG